MAMAPAELLSAVARNDTVAVTAQLDAGADIETTTLDGDSALANAVFNGHRAVVHLLLARGADPNAANRMSGDTVLMWAAVRGDMLITDLLLRHGANVNAENKNGFRALYRAAYKGHTELVKLLLCAGAEPRAKTNLPPPKTALDQARECGFTDVADVLVAWERLDGQERIKEEYPDAASNYLKNSFVSGSVLSKRATTTSPPRR